MFPHHHLLPHLTRHPLARINAHLALRLALPLLMRATLNSLNPAIAQHLRDTDSLIRVGVEHFQDQALDGRFGKVLEELAGACGEVGGVGDEAVGVGGLEFAPRGHVLGIGGLGLGGFGPGLAVEVHGDEDDGAGPDVEGAGVVVAC